MSETKFTQGPWNVTRDHSRYGTFQDDKEVSMMMIDPNWEAVSHTLHDMAEHIFREYR